MLNLLRNAGWLGSAELVCRILRLLTTVAVARLLLPEDYGLAAMAITANECVQMLSRHGVFSRLVQAPAADLPWLTRTAYWLNWLQGAVLAVFQLLLAVAIGYLYQQPTLILPIALLGLSHLLLPIGLVQAALTVRDNRLNISAQAETLQCAADVALTLTLALAGYGFWALVIPKVVVVPVWTAVFRYHQCWRISGRPTLHGWRSILRFSLPVTGVEVLTTLRQYGDYLLVGYALGSEALGIYYFAFNAGLGISLSLIGALNRAFFPHLCHYSDRPEQLHRQFHHGLRLIALITVPLIVLQTATAPWLVPLIFGQQWLEAGALPVLMLICLSALPRPFAEAVSQLLRAVGRPGLELYAGLVMTVLLLTAVAIALPWGITGVALAVMLVHWLVLPVFCIWALYRIGYRVGSTLQPAVA